MNVAAPASAHDQLVASSPSAGEALTEAPAQVSLEFGAEVLTAGAMIVIADAQGTDWVAAAAVPQGTAVTADVRAGMPDGGYELRWRVVSADGHPISGIIPFTVGDGEPLVRDAETGTDAATTGAPAEGSAQESQASQENPALRTVLIGAGGAVVAISPSQFLSKVHRVAHRAAVAAGDHLATRLQDLRDQRGRKVDGTERGGIGQQRAQRVVGFLERGRDARVGHRFSLPAA